MSNFSSLISRLIVLLKEIALVVSPLLSLALLNLGAGFLMSYIPIVMNHSGYSNYIVGFIMACYYIGSLFGSYLIERVISKIKHAKTYLVCCSILVLTLIAQGLTNEWWAWGLLRIIFGFCIAGLFVVIESWLLAMSSSKTRGQILAVYMIALYSTESVAQLFLKINNLHGFFPFGLAAIFIAISLIPIIKNTKPVPSVEHQNSLTIKMVWQIPVIGIIGCTLSGILIASYRAFLPLLLEENMHLSNDIYANLLGLVVLGGMLIQYPIGKLSDIFARKKVIIGLGIFIIFTNCMLIICFYLKWLWLFNLMLFLFGGGVFALYPLSINYSCDLLSVKDLVAANAALSLVYSFGAIIGPWLLAPSFVWQFNYVGIFILFTVLTIIFTLIAAIKVDKAHKQEPFIDIVSI